MTDTTKSVHCVRDLRDYPVESYRLPSDGREWMHQARNRQQLAGWLATFADGDGTRCYPSVKSMTAHFGWSRGTTFRLLKDLKALGFQKRTGRLPGFGGRGVAVRTLVVSALPEVSNSKPEVSNSHLPKSQTQNPESQTQMPESQTREPESHVAETQPSTLTVPLKPTLQPPAQKSENDLTGWEGWITSPNPATIGVPTATEERQLKALARREQHGFAFLKKAVTAFANREMGFVGLKKISPWRLFLKDADQHLRQAKIDCMASRDWRLQNIPGEREFSEASIDRQTEEINRFMRGKPDENEASIDDFID